MDRLTARTHDGHAYLANVKDDEQEVECRSRNTAQCIMDSWERLAAYEDTGLSPADIPALTARAEAAEAERDRAIKQMCRFCKSLDKKAGIKPVCAADCEWRGQQAGKGGAE